MVSFGSVSFLLFSSVGWAVIAHNPAAYHFAPDGNDSNSGLQAQQATSPWRSLSRLDSVLLLPGDSVLFRRGGHFFGGLKPRFSGRAGRPILYGAYGTGPVPVIDQAIVIKGWTLYRGRIYWADAPQPIFQLFVDGKPLVLARYPNHGFIPIVNSRGDDILQTTDSAFLKPDADSIWKGAAIQIKTERFSLDARKIAKIDSDSGFIHLDRGTNYPMKAGRGYFVNGALEALDTAGEWFFDPLKEKVFAWMPQGVSAAGHVITGSVLDHGLLSKGRDFLIVENLRFSHAAKSGIDLENAYGITLRKCKVEFAGGEGMKLEGKEISILDNSLMGAVQAGLELRGSRSRICGNRIAKTGLLDRLGHSGFGGGCCRGNGIEFYGNDNVVSGNKVSSSGYNGIRFEGRHSLIEKNLIDSSCISLDDGAGIYTWAARYSDSGSTGSIIRMNIILNGIGSGTGPRDTATSAYGIYLDHCVQELTVAGNTIVNSDIGIYLHDTRNHTLSGNILYHNRHIQLYLKRDYLDSGEMFGNRISGNVIFATGRTQQGRMERINSVENPKLLAHYSGNYLCLVDSLSLTCSIEGKRIWRQNQTTTTLLEYNFFGETQTLEPVPNGFRIIIDTLPHNSVKPGLFRSKIRIRGAEDFLPASHFHVAPIGGL